MSMMMPCRHVPLITQRIMRDGGRRPIRIGLTRRQVAGALKVPGPSWTILPKPSTLEAEGLDDRHAVL